MIARSLRSIGALALTASVVAGAACSRTEPAPGVLMLAIETDMSAGRDKTIQAVGLYVRDLDRGRTLFQLTEPVAPDGTVRFPATLAIIGRNNPGASVRIRVVGFRRGEAQVMRDAVTTIPTDRTALMALPLRWVNYEKATGTIPQGGTTAPSVHALAGDAEVDPFGVLAYRDCLGESTFIDGQCTSWTVDSSKLPDFVESDVFGGGTADGGGVCFDTVKCFAKPTVLALDSCVAAKPAGAFTLAVKLGPGEEGACVGDGCFIPLDPESDEGWRSEGNGIRLSPGTCKRLVDGHHALVASTECGSKTANAPLCGEASTVGPGSNLPVDLDAGADATLADGRVPDAADAGPTPVDIASGDAPTQLVSDTNNLYYVTRGGIVMRVNKQTPGGEVALNAGFDAGAPTAENYKIAITPAKDRLLLGQVAAAGIKSYPLPLGAPVSSLNTAGALTALAVSATNALYLDTTGTLRACVLTGCSATEPPIYQYPTTSFLAYDATLDGVFLLGVTNGNPATTSIFRHATQTPSGLTPEIAEGLPPAGPLVFDVGTTGNVYWMTIGPSGGIYAATKSAGASTSQGTLIVTDDFTNPGGGITKVTHEMVVDTTLKGSELFWTNAKGEVRAARAAVPTTVVTLATAQNVPMGITVDASFVYWTSMGGNKVRRLPRPVLP